MNVSRADRTPLAEWWRTIDRVLLGTTLLLMVTGFILSFAASPPVAERLGLDPSHFTLRHGIYLVPSVAVLIGLSFLTPRQVRRAAVVLFAISVLLLLATLFVGAEVKGSRRWIAIGGFTLQPSEFVKPAFVVICAWLFAENSRRPEIPGNLFSIILFGITASLLIAQPDFGQTMLLGGVWGAMFFLAGMSWIWIAGLGGLALAGMAAAYFLFPHVAGRIDRFLTGEGDNFQVDTGREAIVSGGWLGQGPGEGTVKRYLPDSHTDFTFAVAAEEFGIVACLILVAIFLFVVIRVMSAALKERDAYVRLAACGLVLLFGMQSMINMMVTLQLLPAKGMTLPFISYGGSSLISMSIAMGFVLALTRRRPDSLRNEQVGLQLRAYPSAE